VLTNVFRGSLALARHDLLSLLRSPLGWCSLAAFMLLTGRLFLNLLEFFMSRQSSLVVAESETGITAIVVAGTCKSAGLLLLAFTPALSMGSFAGEARRGTLPLLLSSPMGAAALTAGKFLGLLGFFALMVLLVIVMTLTLGLGGTLDTGLLGACALGLLLLAALFASAGVFVSSLCREPAAAAVACLALLAVLWLADPGVSADTPQHHLAAYLSVTRHFHSLVRGVFTSADLAYFALMTVVFLALTVARLQRIRGTT
jgi:ABC-2 type transport system permease protein